MGGMHDLAYLHACQRNKGRGGGANCGQQSDGVIYTHPECAKSIMDFVLAKISMDMPDKMNMMLDACCGNGVLGHQLVLQFGEMMDYVDYKKPESFHSAGIDICFYRADILCWKPDHRYSIIVCNPPFQESLSTPIYYHLQSLLEPRGILIYFNTVQWFIQSRKRCGQVGFKHLFLLDQTMFIPSGTGLLHIGIGIYVNDRKDDGIWIRRPDSLDEMVREIQRQQAKERKELLERKKGQGDLFELYK